MPLLQKALSDDEKYQFAQIENVVPEFIEELGDQSRLDDIVFRIFAPHAHTARNEYEKRKNEQLRQKKWLDVIFDSQVSLRVTEDKIRELINQNQSQNNNNAQAAVNASSFAAGLGR